MKNRKYLVSFSSIDPNLATKTQKERIEKLDKLLHEVMIAIQSSSGQTFDYTPEQKTTTKKKQKRMRKLQRLLARQKIGSNHRNKVKQNIVTRHQRIVDKRRDFNHPIHRISLGKKDKDSQVIEKQIFMIENLKMKNMTKSRDPKPHKPGHSAGKIMTLFLGYKANHSEKVGFQVSSGFSSQEYAPCAHIHPDNQQTQSKLICQSCEHAENTIRMQLKSFGNEQNPREYSETAS